MFEIVIDRICQFQYIIEYDVPIQTYLSNTSSYNLLVYQVADYFQSSKHFHRSLNNDVVIVTRFVILKVKCFMRTRGLFYHIF